MQTPLLLIFHVGSIYSIHLLYYGGMAVLKSTCLYRYINITADDLLNVSCAMQNQKNHRPTTNGTKVSTIVIT